jgi:DNA-binding Lrp family transcriptional regulator
MSQRAYVLIKAEKGEADTVAAELTHQDGVLTADQVFGRCDVVAVVEADDLQGLVSIVRNEIALAEHVVHTETLVVTSGMRAKRTS